MSHRSFRVVVLCLAQRLEWVRAGGACSQAGLGAGSIKLTCDSDCTGNQVHSSEFGILFGRQFGSRLRAEAGVHFQRHGDPSADVTIASGGMSVYLAGNLHVRGAAAYVARVSVQEANATKIDRTVSGGTAVSSAGTVSAVNFGVSIGRSPRHPYVCVSATGERLRLSRTNACHFQDCLNAIAARLRQTYR